MKENEQNISNNKNESSLSQMDEEKLTMIMSQIENRVPGELSEKHLDSYFEQRGKVHQFIHEENMAAIGIKNKDRDYQLYITLGVIVSFIVVILIVAITYREILKDIFGYIFAFLGGSAVGGGIGFGISNRNKKDTSTDIS